MIRVGTLLRLGFGDKWGGCDVEQDPIEAFAWGTLDIVGYPNRILSCYGFSYCGRPRVSTAKELSITEITPSSGMNCDKGLLLKYVPLGKGQVLKVLREYIFRVLSGCAL